MIEGRTYRLIGRTHYQKHAIDGYGVEHVLSFTPDDKTDTVTLESELDGFHTYTKEVTRQSARELWQHMVRQGYRRLLSWYLPARIATKLRS